MANPRQKRVLFISTLGTVLEFFDYALYGVFSAQIASTFFPTESEILSLIAALGAFAAGFIMRPFGALIFGYIGDRFGRKRALGFSILLMGIPTLMMGLLPSYQEIGIMAPLLIVLGRLIQGICAGGEYNGAAVFALEHLQKARPGLFGAILAGSGGLGVLLAMATAALLTTEQGVAVHFRIPFLLGALISVIGFFLRRYLDETPDFQRAQAINEQRAQKFTFGFAMIAGQKLAFAVAIAIGALDGVLSYFLGGFFHVFLSQFTEISLQHAIYCSTFGLIVYLVTVPIMGLLFDRYGAQKFMRVAFGALIIIPPFIFATLTTSVLSYTFAAVAVFALLLASISGSEHALLQQMFPVERRYTCISFGFSLGTAFLGGSSPALMTYLIHRSHVAILPGFYISLLAACCLAIFHWHSKVGQKSGGF